MDSSKTTSDTITLLKKNKAQLLKKKIRRLKEKKRIIINHRSFYYNVNSFIMLWLVLYYIEHFVLQNNNNICYLSSLLGNSFTLHHIQHHFDMFYNATIVSPIVFIMFRYMFLSCLSILFQIMITCCIVYSLFYFVTL